MILHPEVGTVLTLVPLKLFSEFLWQKNNLVNVLIPTYFPISELGLSNFVSSALTLAMR